MLTLTFYGAGRKHLLCLRFGRKDPFCFLTGNRISAGHAPAAQLMRLRKYAADRRVAACVAQYWHRRLWLLAGNSVPAEAGAMLTWLLLDLREGPSLHFLDAQAKPEAEDVRWPAPATGGSGPCSRPPYGAVWSIWRSPNNGPCWKTCARAGEMFFYTEPYPSYAPSQHGPCPRPCAASCGRKAVRTFFPCWNMPDRVWCWSGGPGTKPRQRSSL